MNPQPLPIGHPPLDPMDPAGSPLPPSVAPQSSLEYKAPARWVLVPNASTMRLATYRIPRAPGDTEDAELSITQAGGSVEANADRWVGQFDAAGQRTAKRSTRNVGALTVTTVEVQGKFEGGMGKDAGTGWALLGAIIATPGTPHFFKLTGPAKTVLAARAEFEAMMATLVQQRAAISECAGTAHADNIMSDPGHGSIYPRRFSVTFAATFRRAVARPESSPCHCSSAARWRA
jgi:hypothetical protein